MNSFDAAISRKLVARLEDEGQRLAEIVLSGQIEDMNAYAKVTSELNAYNKVRNWLTDIERELKQ